MAGEQNGDGLKKKRFSMFSRQPSDRGNQRRNGQMRSNQDAHTHEEDNNSDDFSDFTSDFKSDIGDEGELNFLNHGPPEVKKSRGRPQKQHWTHEWSDKATEALIELWSKKEELYNKQHPQFYVKEAKDRAVEDIKNSLNELGFNVTENNILSKFQSLRTYFCTQRTKTSNAKRGIYGPHQDEGESKWRFYKNLLFLDDNMKQREGGIRKYSETKQEYDIPPPSFAFRSMVNMEQHQQQSFRDYPDPSSDYMRESHDINGINYGNNAQLIDGNSTVPTTIATSTTPSSNHHSSNDMMNNSNNGMQHQHQKPHQHLKTKHEDFLFGELVGNMIHQLPPGQHKDMIKLQIQQLIIKAKYSSSNSNNNNNNGNLSNYHEEEIDSQALENHNM